MNEEEDQPGVGQKPVVWVDVLCMEERRWKSRKVGPDKGRRLRRVICKYLPLMGNGKLSKTYPS